MKKLFAAFSFLLIITAMIIPGISANGPADRRPDGNVQVETDGLMAVCTGDPSRASVAILDMPHHTPELLVKSGNKQILKLTGKEQIGTLTIGIDSDTHSINQFTPGAQASRYDFHWTIDLEGDIFQKRLNLNPKTIAAKIHFLDGTLYADQLSEEVLTFTHNTVQHPFKRRIGLPAMAINIKPGQTLLISDSNGQIVARLPYVDAGYSVSIHNLPPADLANLNHFLMYYSALTTKETIWEPVLIEKVVFPRPAICGSVVFSHSSLAEQVR